MDFNAILNSVMNWVTTTGIKLLIAIIVLIVSFKVINVVIGKIEKKMVEGDKKVDKTLAKTLMYILKLVLKIAIAVCLVGYVGIDTSGITALITSLGVCVGLAVNGAVANFAGGVLLIITRPFRVDDFIEACGYSGTVEEIHMTLTRLRTGDNKIIYIPNGSLSTSTIVNYSMKDVRRVDFTFSIAYENDYQEARNIIYSILDSHELVLKEPAEPFVRMSAHGASSIDIVARAWVNSGDYWTVNFDVLETVKSEFDKNGISIPYNQLDVHVKND